MARTPVQELIHQAWAVQAVAGFGYLPLVKAIRQVQHMQREQRKRADKAAATRRRNKRQRDRLIEMDYA